MQEVMIYTFNDMNYILVDRIDNYLYLSNENNPHDMMIRKEDLEDDTILLPLDNKEEFDKALRLLSEKRKFQAEN